MSYRILPLGQLTSFNNFLMFYQPGREGMLPLPTRTCSWAREQALALGAKLEVTYLCWWSWVISVAIYTYDFVLCCHFIKQMIWLCSGNHGKLCLLYRSWFPHHCLVAACPDACRPLTWGYRGSLPTFVMSCCLHSQNKGHSGFQRSGWNWIVLGSHSVHHKLDDFKYPGILLHSTSSLFVHSLIQLQFEKFLCSPIRTVHAA